VEINRQRQIAALVWLAALGAGLYLYAFEPGRSGFFLFCPFRALTGLTCPGCGTTRCLHQLLRGNFADAFKLNPLFFVAAPFLLLVILNYTRKAIQGDFPGSFYVRPLYAWLMVGVIVCFWIVRNLSFYPFPT
jgi:Protein of unknown function (DUF2752)